MVHPSPPSRLEDFMRDPSLHLDRLRKTGRPQVLRDENGDEIVVQDAAAYRRMLDAIDLAESDAAIREALAQIDRGEGREARDVIAAIRRDLGLRATGT